MPETQAVREGREKAESLRFEYRLATAPIRDLFGFIENSFRPGPGRSPADAGRA